MPFDLIDPHDFPGGGGGGVPRESEVALYCLLFYSRNTALDREVADYAIRGADHLDSMFGPRLQGFAIALPEDGEETAEAVADMYRYARAYGVGPDRFPCALLVPTLDPGEKALRLRLGAFLPPSARRESDDIAVAFQEIAGAAERCADVAQWRRVGSLQRSLRRARLKAYGERAPRGKRVLDRVDGDLQAVERITTNGQRLLVTAAAAATLLVGGPLGLSVVADPGPTPAASSSRTAD